MKSEINKQADHFEPEMLRPLTDKKNVSHRIPPLWRKVQWVGFENDSSPYIPADL